MYYYVPEENLEAERNEPCSTYRLPNDEGRSYRGSADRETAPMYLWNQAMFVIAQLLTASLLHINELDPIRRYLPSYNRPRRAGRYSAFQVRGKASHIAQCDIFLFSFTSLNRRIFVRQLQPHLCGTFCSAGPKINTIFCYVSHRQNRTL